MKARDLTLPAYVVHWLIAYDGHHLRIVDTPSTGRVYVIEDENQDLVAEGATIDQLVANLKVWAPK